MLDELIKITPEEDEQLILEKRQEEAEQADRSEIELLEEDEEEF